MHGYLTTKDVAELLGVQPKSVRQYRWRDEEFPAPDEHAGPMPLWKEETIERWRKNRKSTKWKRSK